jgi:hypothetical protein
MAAMVVLDKLTPEQRVAFVLHDAFSVPFGEIAGILGCTPDARSTAPVGAAHSPTRTRRPARRSRSSRRSSSASWRRS